MFNIKGIIQFLLYPNNFTSVYSLIFFAKYGFLSVIPSEDTIYISSSYKHDIFSTDILFGHSTLLRNFPVGSNIFSLQLLQY